MYFEKKDLELTDDILIDIVSCAKEVFCQGVYIYCDEHPCGWDFINFDCIDDYEEVLEYKFDNYDISGGCYCSHKYENKTLKEILIDNECRFEFER